MIDKLDKSLCTGCYGCMNVCPKDAITFCEDNEGFKYPRIDSNKCIKCNLCEKRCPIMTHLQNKNTDTPQVYAAWNKNEEIRVNSTSGGIFTALASAVLKNGGYVAGAVYTQDFSIKHIVISKTEELEKLRQSKYAQSDIGETYRNVKFLLSKGK